MANLEGVRRELDDLTNDQDLAERIALAMKQCNHRWAAIEGYPDQNDVLGVMGSLGTTLMCQLLEHPEKCHHLVSTGGITIYYWRWEYSEEVSVKYSPVGLFRTLGI